MIMKPLREVDPEIYSLIRKEKRENQKKF